MVRARFYVFPSSDCRRVRGSVGKSGERAVLSLILLVRLLLLSFFSGNSPRMNSPILLEGLFSIWANLLPFESGAVLVASRAGRPAHLGPSCHVLQQAGDCAWSRDCHRFRVLYGRGRRITPLSSA
ncbi:hypothetical protein RRG08_003530 [Elysia crispata]|uniref:Uncharacterized protein n=1 Tax=Elysia crispata TaxID=231223 RepID=A0AAE0Y6F6_9GAST|nr:hypothetical protein RRG08_003530 [Elysia crispata]